MNNDLTTLLLTILAAGLLILVGSQPRELPPARPSLSRAMAQALTQPAIATQRAPIQPATTQSAAMIRAATAREALKTVGLDSKSNAIWTAALYDKEIPPRTRQDLLEDLNEVGFADPMNLTTNDLPLIEGRLTLLEKLALGALDQADAEGCAEAYKDLQQMRTRAAGH